MRKKILPTFICALATSFAFAETEYTEVSSVYLSAGTSAEYLTTSSSNELVYIVLSSGSSLTNSDFSGSTLTNANSPVIHIYGVNDGTTDGKSASSTIVENVSFANMTINSPEGSTYFPIQIGTNLPGDGCETSVLTNVDFSGSTYTLDSDLSYMVVVYSSTLNNVSFDGIKASITGDNYANAFWFSSAKITSSSFRNMSISIDVADTATYGYSPIAVSGNANQWTTLMDTSFYGTTFAINGGDATLFNLEHIELSSDGSVAELKNLTLGDGEIYSAGVITWKYDIETEKYYTDSDFTTEFTMPDNKGIMLSAIGDILTIKDDSYLSVSCEISAGDLVFEGGSTLTLNDDISLTIVQSDDLSISVYDWNLDTLDISDLFEMGENSSIVIAGTSSESLLSSLSDMITVYDSDGVELDNVNITDFNGVLVVPEPSTYAMIFGGIALGLAMYRRRK